jgi:hypothetical protein
MNLFSNVKSLLHTNQTTSTVVSIISTADLTELPQGFFRVLTASGAESLGYNCALFLCWDCGETVVVGAHRVKLDKARSELPLVKLSFARQMEGVQQVGSHRIVDTDALDGDSGAITWGGQKIRSGVDYI